MLFTNITKVNYLTQSFSMKWLFFMLNQGMQQLSQSIRTVHSKHRLWDCIQISPNISLFFNLIERIESVFYNEFHYRISFLIRMNTVIS